MLFFQTFLTQYGTDRESMIFIHHFNFTHSGDWLIIAKW